MRRESYQATKRIEKIASMSLDEQRRYLESEKRAEPESDSAGSRAAQCSTDECGACETYRKAWLAQLNRADILEHALNEIRLMTHDAGALARAEDALKRSLSNGEVSHE